MSSKNGSTKSSTTKPNQQNRLDSVTEPDDGAIVEVARKIEAGLGSAKESAGKASDMSLNDCVDGCKSYVEKNPGKAVLFSVGAGLLLGALLRRR